MTSSNRKRASLVEPESVQSAFHVEHRADLSDSPSVGIDEVGAVSDCPKKNASRATAVRGWNLLREQGGPTHLSHEELNDLLREEGLDRVADRTWSHYGRMWTLRYRGEYLPINRFDVARSTGRWGKE